MEHLNIFTTILGGIVFLFGLGSKWLQRSPFPPTVLALLLGVAIGPAGTGWLNLDELGERSRILEGLARLTLAIGLVGVALRIPREYPRKNWPELTGFILAAMLLMFVISTCALYFILQLPLTMAALIGAIVTATDPVASSPIVSGELSEKTLPERVRHFISFESGANDGLGYLLVFLPFLIMTLPQEQVISHWLFHTLLSGIVVGAVLGGAIGYGAGKLLHLSEDRGLIAEHWRLVYTVAVALFAVGAGRLSGTDEVLVVFAAGVAFVQVVSGSDRKNEEHGQEAINRFFAIPIFVVLGAAIPWEGWTRLGAAGLLLALAILLFRRVPVLLLLKPVLPSVRSWPDALFIGWFGPIAVAAIYYATLMEHRLGNPLVWEVTSLIVCASVLAHGMTAAPFTRWYRRAAK
jgi:sodium/hydrogen antiporter